MYTDAVVYHRPAAPAFPIIAPTLPSNGIISDLNAWRSHFYSAPTTERRVFRKIRHWLSHEVAYLHQSYPTRMSARDIAAELGRSVGAIRSKARALGLRRPRKGDDQKQEHLPLEKPPRENLLLQKTASGRAIWSDEATLTLAKLWTRLVAPGAIGKLLGIKPGAVSEAANRAGLPSREGLILIRDLTGCDPFTLPENQLVASEMVEKRCPTRGKLFFVRPRDRRSVHVSKEGRKTIARRQVNEFAYA